jgi:hypothetical protein
MSATKKSKKEDPDFVLEGEDKPEETEPHIEHKTAKDISVTGGSRSKRFVSWYKSHKKKSIPLTSLVILVLLAAIPWSRYHLTGLVLKNNYNFEVVDASAGTAISGADVAIGSSHSVTDGTGKVTLQNVPVGHRKVLITKKYYKDETKDILIPILKQKTTTNLKLVATGRQVKISVKNLINHTPLANVDISIAGVTAKTDNIGNAIVVLSAGTQNAKANLSLDGYNNADVNVLVDDKTIKENDFNLTPSGKVYFLSKLSGKIDIVKTNLDGSGRQTVLAGTGKEDDAGTILLVSRDWKYLALLSKREGLANPKLYIINTSNDSLLPIETDATQNINLVGWSDNYFVYYTQSNNPAFNLCGPSVQTSLKSYNAQASKSILLDKTKSEGAGQDTVCETLSTPYINSKNVIYAKSWGADDYSRPSIATKQDAIYSAGTNGTASQNIQNLGQSMRGRYISSIPYEANEIYFSVSDGDKTSYYSYSNSKVSSRNDIADDINKYYQSAAKTYLFSPSGSNTLWSESRDGKNTLFVGDQDGENGKQIATLSDYQTYGWYTDDYLLVSKNSSELYIASESGISKDSDAIKITDYHKPARSFYGYGGGYGGI